MTSPDETPNPDMRTVCIWTAYIVMAALILVVFCCICGYAMRTNNVEHCYMETRYENGATIHYLKGYREWESDLTISRHDSITNAYRAAVMLKCPVLRH